MYKCSCFNILAAKISALELQMSSVGTSLGSICQVIDNLGDASSDPFDCCSDSTNMQTRCQLRSVNLPESNPILGISWNNDSPGTCNSNDAMCSVANGS